MSLTQPIGRPWQTSDFYPVVDIPAGYRRCAHKENGFQCTNVYQGSKASHAHCNKHRGEPVMHQCEECGNDFPRIGAATAAKTCGPQCRAVRNMRHKWDRVTAVFREAQREVLA